MVVIHAATPFDLDYANVNELINESAFSLARVDKSTWAPLSSLNLTERKRSQE